MDWVSSNHVVPRSLDDELQAVEEVANVAVEVVAIWSGAPY